MLKKHGFCDLGRCGVVDIASGVMADKVADREYAKLCIQLRTLFSNAVKLLYR